MLLPPPSHNFTSRSRSRSRAASRRGSPAESLLESATTATTTITTTSTPAPLLSRRVNRPRGSICNDANRDQRKPFNEWFDRLTGLVNQAMEKGFDDFDEFSAIQATVEETTKKLVLVAEYRENHPENDIKVTTFSTATYDDLARIGFKHHGIDSSILSTAVKGSIRARPLATIQSVANIADRVLDDIRGFVSTQNEPGARIVINQLLLETKRVCSDFEESLFLRVEVRLPGPRHVSKFEYRQKTTFVSGIIDYGIGVLATGESYRESTSIRSGNLQTIDVIIENGGVRRTFVVLEAKADDQQLVNHLPQVILQCMALPKDVTSCESNVVAFALANSTTWIFGSLHFEERGSNGARSIPVGSYYNDWRLQARPRNAVLLGYHTVRDDIYYDEETPKSMTTITPFLIITTKRPEISSRRGDLGAR